MREYTRNQTLLANLPYAAMVTIGTATIATGLGFSAGALASAAGYLVYGVAGAVWIMVFVCRYCDYHGTRGCPCGYGLVSARFVPKGERECFAQKFKRHIPVIVPLWLIPVACGAIALHREYSRGLAGLVAVFAINSFAILPLVSRRHSCSECPQKDGCPWMAQRSAST